MSLAADGAGVEQRVAPVSSTVSDMAADVGPGPIKGSGDGGALATALGQLSLQPVRRRQTLTSAPPTKNGGTRNVDVWRLLNRRCEKSPSFSPPMPARSVTVLMQLRRVRN